MPCASCGRDKTTRPHRGRDLCYRCFSVSRDAEHRAGAIKVLSRVIDLLGESRESAFASESPAEMLPALRSALQTLRSGGEIDKPFLQVLFFPTGPLQDTAIDNGWGDEFCALADLVDDYIGVKKCEDGR
jgi:hypothetical protein